MRQLARLQSEIRDAREKLVESETERRTALAKVAEVDEAITAKLLRTGRPQLSATDPLRKRREKLTTKVDKERVNSTTLERLLEQLRGRLERLKTHRELVETLDDGFPVLLMPVRVQFRFMRIKHVTRDITRTLVMDVAALPKKAATGVSGFIGDGLLAVGDRPLGLLTSSAPRRRRRRPRPLLAGFGVLEALKEAGATKSPKMPTPGMTALPSDFIDGFRRHPRGKPQPPKQRFKKVEDSSELWIRIFPDDAAIRSHEELLTADEVAAAEAYWKELWLADEAFAQVTSPTPAELAAAEAARQEHKIGAWRALHNGYGPYRAAWIVRVSEPANRVAGGDTDFTEAPAAVDLDMKTESWSAPPTAELLPDRFVVRLYLGQSEREVEGRAIPDSLHVGIDPEELDDDAFSDDRDALKLPDKLKWMGDFAEAEKVGMAIRVQLSPQEARTGFDRLVVLGVRVSADEEESRVLLERHLDNHHYKEGGMAVLPQGTPTNNTRAADSGFSSRGGEAADSHGIELGDPLFSIETDDQLKSDGQRLAEALGIRPEVLQHIEDAGGTDITESLWMNRALWPATLGYYLNQFWSRHIRASDVEGARAFFTGHVTGRGALPAIRIDNQPYGFVATTAYSRLRFPTDLEHRFVRRLYRSTLEPLMGDWEDLAEHVKSLTDPSLPAAAFTEAFLEVVGLHASSVQFYQRALLGPTLVWNLANLNQSELIALTDPQRAMELLMEAQSSGYQIAGPPPIFQHFTLKDVKQLKGPVVDGLPLSETRTVRAFPGSSSNYIDWLATAHIDDILAETFDSVGANERARPPRALLYLLLRHAVLRETIDTVTDVLSTGNVASAALRFDFELDQLTELPEITPEHEKLISSLVRFETMHRAMENVRGRADAAFGRQGGPQRDAFMKAELEEMAPRLEVEIGEEVERQKAAFQVDPDRWSYLSSKFPSVTGRRTVMEHLDDLVSRRTPETLRVRQQKAAIGRLRGLPTARLERAFAEHIDLCSHRLDGWLEALVKDRLARQRAVAGAEQGIYLGAYGYLEEVRPGPRPGVAVKTVRATPVAPGPGTIAPTVDAKIFTSKAAIGRFIRRSFLYLGSDPKTDLRLEGGKVLPAPLVDDGEGYMHAPSIPHAMAAAVLRAGYSAHRTTGSPEETLAVNLTSRRVRTALGILEGMSNGQELAALLGYRFERSLHDNETGPLDGFILDLRLKYPLRAGSVTELNGADSVADAESFNVIDGIALLDAFRQGGNSWFDDVPSLEASSSGRVKVQRHIESLASCLDAVADLLIAESVYQMTLGRPERSAAALRTLNEGGTVLMPEVVDIPRPGTALTHRVAISIEPGGDATVWRSTPTPASIVEPNLNRWLGDQLPHPSKMCVGVILPDGTPNKVRISDLALEPIDFVLEFGSRSGDVTEGALTERIREQARAAHGPFSTDGPIGVDYDRRDFTATQFSLFELEPLIRALYELVTASRPLRPEDLVPPSEAQADVGAQYETGRLEVSLRKITEGTGPHRLQVRIDAIDAAVGALPVIDEAVPPSATDELRFRQLQSAVFSAQAFGIPNAVPRDVAEVSGLGRADLLQQAVQVRGELAKRLKAAESALAVASTLTDEEARLRRLIDAAHAIFGRGFPVLPEFRLVDEDSVRLSLAHTGLLADAGVDAVDEWLQGVSVVRPHMGRLQRIGALREAFAVRDRDRSFSVAQLPYRPDGTDRWVGARLPAGYEGPGDPLSMVMELPRGYDTADRQLGLLCDEWTEVIPSNEVDAGIAMHFDQPNAEPPQCLLLAVTPDESGNWAWDDLVATIVDTIAVARMRSVEPDLFGHVSGTSRLHKTLPATVAAINASGTTPTLDYGRNNLPKLTELLSATGLVFAHMATLDLPED